eukprot:366063-Chlamydomonas_euryale.AAC.9
MAAVGCVANAQSTACPSPHVLVLPNVTKIERTSKLEETPVRVRHTDTQGDLLAHHSICISCSPPHSHAKTVWLLKTAHWALAGLWHALPHTQIRRTPTPACTLCGPCRLASRATATGGRQTQGGPFVSARSRASDAMCHTGRTLSRAWRTWQCEKCGYPQALAWCKDVWCGPWYGGKGSKRAGVRGREERGQFGAGSRVEVEKGKEV